MLSERVQRQIDRLLDKLKRILVAALLGAIALLPATATAGVLDQENIAGTGHTVSVGGSVRLAQTFTAGLTGNLDQVSVLLVGSQGNPPTAPLNVALHSVNGGQPTESVLGSGKLPGTSIQPFVGNLLLVTILPPVAVTAGTQYAIVLSSVSSLGTYKWIVSDFAPDYLGGTGWTSQSGAAFVSLSPAGDMKFRTFVSPPGAANWFSVPGAAVDIAAGIGPSAYALGTTASPGGQQIFEFVDVPSIWQNLPGAAEVLAVDLGGDLWATQNAASGNGIYVRSGGAWLAIPGAAVDITASSSGRIYALSTQTVPGGFSIFRFEGAGKWLNIPGGAAQLAEAPNGFLWARQSNDDIYRYQEATGVWSQIPGKAVKLAAGGGNIFALGTTPSPGGFLIYKYVGGAAVWQNVPGAAVDLAVGPQGDLWAIQDAAHGNGIFRCTTC